jgi:Glycosyltransferase (GlcNAc)
VGIFVSIAAYRDPQLTPTIRDCIGKARDPDQLHFGVCWQHGADDEPLSLPQGAHIRLIEVDWRESRGVCWARAEIMKLWDGEDYFFQLDSHHRFAPGWDHKLINYMRKSVSAKPILTTYGTPFIPGSDEVLDNEPMQMNFDCWTSNGIAVFRPGLIPNWRRRKNPIRARFVSAHFLFTLGEFVNEVPYDPELYFLGEEITLAIRAYTHGYDLYHPPEPIVWHEYTRSYRPKHWDDHVKAPGVEIEWHQHEKRSVEKIRQFLEAPVVGQLACGPERSFADYEAFAGLSFRYRRAQEYTLRFEDPPNPPMPANWAEGTQTWRLVIALDRAALPCDALDDPQFWYVGAQDANGQEIYREDLYGEELLYLLAASGPQIVIERKFASYAEPLSWTIWPFSRSAGWLDKIEGLVAKSNLAAVTPATPLRRRSAVKNAVLDVLSAVRLPPPLAGLLEATRRRHIPR